MRKLVALPGYEEVNSAVESTECDHAREFAAATRVMEKRIKDGLVASTQRAEGVLSYDHTVEAAFKTLSHLFGPDPKHGVAIDMPVRIGKSGVINLIAELLHLYMGSFGINGEVAIVPYPMVASIEDMRSKLAMAKAIYPKIAVDGSKRPLHAASPKSPDSMIRTRSKLRLWKQYLDTVPKNRVLYLLLDEADYGSEIMGRMDQIMEYGRGRDIKIMLVAVSATAWEFKDAADLNLVSITVPRGIGYSGLFEGDWLRIEDWTTVAEQYGIKPLLRSFRSRIDGLRIAPHAAELVMRLF